MAEITAELEAEVQAQVDLLARQYAERLPEKLARIDEAWLALQQKWDSELRDQLLRQLHNLTGSGASFGFTALSDRAREMELLVRSLTEPPTAEQADQFVALLAGLKQAAFKSDGAELVETPAVEVEGLQGDNMVYLLEPDATMGQDLARQLGYFGYPVRIFATLESLQQVTSQQAPAVVIMDVQLPEGAAREDGIGKTIVGPDGHSPTLIFISARADIEARMEAVRAGGAAYFTMPVDVGSLVDKLDKLTIHQATEPYRVLIVDDDPSLAAYHAFFLKRAGMITSVVTDPLQLMAPLIELKPDLILMDMYMPGITGTELAAVIRQQEAYVSIPIVFLSGETDISKQLLAMQLGGDDFLVKPIKPDHLISAITSRVERLRILRSFMVRDSLTGLLNHTFMKQQLDIEVARARRRGSPLTFAIIDIDHFKQVNDTYGHPTGDRVIKSLSRLLKQRLRETDLIGRFGGEEFAIILPDTDAEAAARVLDELRAGFAQIHHQSQDKRFYVTFSGGIASLPPGEDPAMLNDEADKALYQAKQAGRNRVVVAR